MYLLFLSCLQKNPNAKMAYSGLAYSATLQDAGLSNSKPRLSHSVQTVLDVTRVWVVCPKAEGESCLHVGRQQGDSAGIRGALAVRWNDLWRDRHQERGRSRVPPSHLISLLPKGFRQPREELQSCDSTGLCLLLKECDHLKTRFHL